jgi:hypothetical protein
MHIEVRHLRHYPSLTEQSPAFHADLYVDDARIGTAENTGHGETYLHISNLPLAQAMIDFASTLQDLDHDRPLLALIDKLVADDLCRARVRQLMQSRIFMIKDGQLTQTHKLSPEDLPRVREFYVNKGRVFATEQQVANFIRSGSIESADTIAGRLTEA